jgi:uncharacterized protein
MSMTLSIYDIAVPTFQKQLASLEAVLDKAAAQAAARNVDFSVYLSARLYPDMFDLTRQIQIATDHAKFAPARLAGVEAPSIPDVEKTLPELKARIAKIQGLLSGYKREQFEGAETRQLTLKVSGQEVTIGGLQYLLHVAFPNFYFHCATAYDILRHNGIEIGKRDFLPQK